MTTRRTQDALDELDRYRAVRDATPRTLFDAAVPAAVVSIEGVNRHAGPEWNRAAYDAVSRTATDHPTFTVENVWEYLDVPVYDRRALGSVMRRAARAGLIASTGNYVHCERAEAHGRPTLIWRSQVWEPTRSAPAAPRHPTDQDHR